MAPSSDGTSGSRAVPELELDVRPAMARTPPLKTDEPPEAPLELAIDARALVRERAATDLAASLPTPAFAGLPDISSDAHLLADYGDPPRHWILSPLYAWRVTKRVRELRAALLGRRDEAARTGCEVDDALVAFAERSRALAEQSADYADVLDELRRAEQVLRSRDQGLAAEQDAQNVRLAQVDARLSGLEGELAQARSDEQAATTELSALEEALAREDGRLRRAEIEVRAAQQRAGGAGAGG